MKKIYLIAAGLFLGFGVNAQTATRVLTSHFEGALTNPASPKISLVTFGANGYVSGTNSYGDKAVVQLFDANYGVSTVPGGTINSIKILVGRKTVAAAGSGSVKIGVWENNGGVPGAEIQMVTVTMAALDTAASSTQLITSGTTVKGLYNNSVNLTNVNIPANGSFFAGIILSTATAAAGDTVAIVTTVPTFVFPGASTHAGTIDTDGDFFAYGEYMNAPFDNCLSNAIFPEVTQSTAGLNDLQKENKLVVYPNPANEQLNFRVEGTEVSSVKVYGMDGKLLISEDAINATTGQINVSALNSGIYIYEVAAANGASSKSTFVKK